MKYLRTIIELKPSLIDKHGVGVFALVDITSGEKVADGLSLEDFNHQITWREIKYFDNETRKKIMDFCVGTPEGFVPPENLNFNKLSIEWYFNHSCDGNLGFDNGGDFITIKDVAKGEELSYDYGLIESNPRFKMYCKCNSIHCRKIITGNDWKFLLRDRYKNKYMHPYLKQIKPIIIPVVEPLPLISPNID